jgi:fanconi anemia group M protein
VLNNLLIAHIELRTEESADIRPYTHERRVEKVVVPLGDELTSARSDYLHVI